MLPALSQYTDIVQILLVLRLLLHRSQNIMFPSPSFAFCLRAQEGPGVPDNSVYSHKCLAFKFKFIDVITKCKYGARIRNTSKNTGDAVAYVYMLQQMWLSVRSLWVLCRFVAGNNYYSSVNINAIRFFTLRFSKTNWKLCTLTFVNLRVRNYCSAELNP